jgi:TP901 family phage tail tape measure protein
MATELGVGYLSILPDLSKLGGLVSKGMTSAGQAGAKAFGVGASKNLGGVAKAFGAAGKDAGEALAKQALAAAKSDINKLSKQMATATDAQANALGRLRVAQTKLTEVQSQAKPKASQLAAAEEAVAAAQRKANSATSAAESVTKNLTAAQGRAKAAAEDVARAQTNAASQATKAGGGAGNRFTQAFKSAFRPSQGAAEQLNKIDGKREGGALAARFGVGFNGAFGGIVSKSAALLAATFATVGVGSLVKDSISLEMTFSQTMSTMASVAKVPAADMKALSDLAIKMGADTTFSAGEAGEAMLELAKGGLSAATIRAGGLEGTLTLAAAGGLGLAEASTIASNALNTFSLKGSDMASVAAALAGGANASSASVESLGQALGQVGPGATIAGLSLQDTVGVLSSFDAAGIKGSDAGTSLKTMLTRLVPSTNQAKAAMRELGLKFTDAQGEFLPITSVAEQLRQKLSKLSAEQQTTALSTIFGSDATRAASVLMKEGAAGIGRYIAATKDQGAATEVATARMSGTAGAWEAFKGSVETAKLQLGLFLAPTIQAGLAKLSTGVNNIVPGVKALAALLIKGDFTAGFRQIFNVTEDSTTVSLLLGLRDAAISLAGVFTGTLLPAAQSVFGFMSDHRTLITTLAVGIGSMVVAFKAYQGILAVVTVATKAWAAIQAVLNIVLAANPIGVIALALIGLAAGLVYAYKNSEKFRGIVNGVFNAMKGVVLGVIDSLVTGFRAVVAGVTWAVNGIRSVWSTIVGVVSAPLNAIVSFLRAVWARIYPIIALPVYIAVGLIKAHLKAIGSAFTAAKNWVTGVFSKAWAAIKGVLAGPVGEAKKGLDTQWGLIKTAFTAVKNWAVGAFAKAWSGLTAKLTGPITTARTALSTILGSAKGGVQWVFSQAVAGIGKVWDGLQELAKKPIRFIVNTVLNDGLIGAFNWVAGKFSAPTIPTISLPQGFASGGRFTGRIPGPPSPVDNILAHGPGGQGIGLATGEFIVNARDTARNLPLLKAINSGQGFATGGLFGKLKDGITGAFNAGRSFSEDALKFLSDPVKWFKERLAGPLNRMSELGSSPYAEVVKSAPRKLVDTVSAKAKDLIGFGGAGGPINPGLAGALNWARSQVGKPYLWGGVGPLGYDCSGFLSAIVNVIRGSNPFQRLFATGSLPAGMFAPGPGAFEIGWYTGNPGHVAGTLNGTNVESRGGRGVVVGPAARGAHDPLFNRHGHLIGYANGGIVGDPPFDLLDPRGKAYKGKAVLPRSALSFDEGGLLPTGYSFVHNGTGKPEPVGHDVLRRGDLDGMKVVLDAGGRVALTGHIRLIASDVVNESGEFTAGVRRMR